MARTHQPTNKYKGKSTIFHEAGLSIDIDSTEMALSNTVIMITEFNNTAMKLQSADTAKKLKNKSKLILSAKLKQLYPSQLT